MSPRQPEPASAKRAANVSLTRNLKQPDVAPPVLMEPGGNEADGDKPPATPSEGPDPAGAAAKGLRAYLITGFTLLAAVLTFLGIERGLPVRALLAEHPAQGLLVFLLVGGAVALAYVAPILESGPVISTRALGVVVVGFVIAMSVAIGESENFLKENWQAVSGAGAGGLILFVGLWNAARPPKPVETPPAAGKAAPATSVRAELDAAMRQAVELTRTAAAAARVHEVGKAEAAKTAKDKADEAGEGAGNGLDLEAKAAEEEAAKARAATVKADEAARLAAVARLSVAAAASARAAADDAAAEEVSTASDAARTAAEAARSAVKEMPATQAKTAEAAAKATQNAAALAEAVAAEAEVAAAEPGGSPASKAAGGVWMISAGTATLFLSLSLLGAGVYATIKLVIANERDREAPRLAYIATSTPTERTVSAVVKGSLPRHARLQLKVITFTGEDPGTTPSSCVAPTCIANTYVLVPNENGRIDTVVSQIVVHTDIRSAVFSLGWQDCPAAEKKDTVGSAERDSRCEPASPKFYDRIRMTLPAAGTTASVGMTDSASVPASKQTASPSPSPT